MSKQPPKWWKPTSGGGVACPVRDLFLCVDYQYAHVEVINVYEEFFWADDESERAVLIAQQTRGKPSPGLRSQVYAD
ncbi:MAG: hypothetical protein ACYCWN_12665 [Ferrimicrobium sp.]|jgi:hypothetical protein|uniref:Uncharacterized protein n=1 Tax=Ferrimicrobium acidiphilum TaxID=121039 RepID=A0ABV3Y5Y6_9ACTN|nr:hypothetical protein [Ferrimicrobium acidiphilum]